MRVRAIEVGYDNVTVRQLGEEFEMPAGAEAPWFEPLQQQRPTKVTTHRPPLPSCRPLP
jgi:hypothetical protein